MKQKQKLDRVIGLITGRFSTVKTIVDGAVVVKQEFIPTVVNPQPTVQEILKTSEYSKQMVMEKLHLINPTLQIDRSEFTKSKFEKDDLKIKKQNYKAGIVNGTHGPLPSTAINFEVWKYLNKIKKH